MRTNSLSGTRATNQSSFSRRQIIDSAVHRRRHARLLALLCATASVTGATSAWAADTAATFSTTATDLSVGTNYSPVITPTAAGAYDIDLNGPYTTTTLDANGTALVFGSLNDLDATQTLSIGNSNATAASLTLGVAGFSNAIAPTFTGGLASDLIFVQNGGTLSIASGPGNLGVTLGVGTGNFNVGGTASGAAGTLNISSVISGASGFGFNKGGYGVLILGGANTYSGNTVESNGQIRLASSSVGTPGTIGSNGSLTSGPLGTAALILSAGFESLDLGGQTMGNRFVIEANNDSIVNSSNSLATVTGAMDSSLNGGVISDFSIGSNNGNILVTGIISRTSGSVGMTKTGTNTVTFNESGANVGLGSTADPVKVSGGVLVAAVNYNSNGGFANSVTVQGGTFQYNPTLGIDSGGNPWGGQINADMVINSGTVDLNGSTGQNSRQQQLSGTGGFITNSSTTAGVIGIAARNSNAYTYAGTIQDGTATGGGTVAVDFTSSGATGSGRINMFTGANTYTGPTSVSYGEFVLGNALAAQNSVVTVSGGSGLGGNSTYGITTTNALGFASSIGAFTIGGLAGAGSIQLTDIGRTAAAATATPASVMLQIGSSLAGNASPAAYSGSISDGSVAGGSVVKIGTSTGSLNGASTYTGGTTIKGGLLYTTNATGFGTGGITLGDTSGSTSAAARWNTGTPVTNPISVASGSSGTLKLSSIWGGGGSSLTGPITLNNNVTFGEDFTSGGNTWTIGGNITGTGNITVANAVAGTTNAVKFGGSNSFTGGVTVTNGSTLYTTANALTIANAAAIDLGSTLNSSGQNLTIAGLNNGASGAGSVTISNSTSQTLTLGGSGVYSFGGPITNSGNVSITNGANQTLTGASTFTGSTTVANGTLSLNDSANATVLGSTSQVSVSSSSGVLKLTSASANPQLINASAPISLTDAGGTSVNPLVVLAFTGTGTGNGGVPVENVFSLSINGVGQLAGLYGVGANNPDSDFGGTGEINVLNSTPEPGVLGALSMSGLMLLRRRRATDLSCRS